MAYPGDDVSLKPLRCSCVWIKVAASSRFEALVYMVWRGCMEKLSLLIRCMDYQERLPSNDRDIYLHSFDHVHDYQLAQTLFLLQTRDLHRQGHRHLRKYTA
jgi:hypothetical protein